MSSGGGKPVQFSAFGQEIHCETSAIRKVTVKPLRYIPLQEQFDNYILLAMLVRFEPAWQRYQVSRS